MTPRYQGFPEKANTPYVGAVPNGGNTEEKSNLKWWLTGLVIFLIIAAAVGGAVGGVLSKKSKAEDNIRLVGLCFFHSLKWSTLRLTSLEIIPL